MIQGHGEKNILGRCFTIGVYSENKAYTFKLEEHDISLDSSTPCTDIKPEELEAFKGLVPGLMDIGLVRENATDAELKATKYHLEDMRKLVMKGRL